jgi:hypothetical protein
MWKGDEVRGNLIEIEEARMWIEQESSIHLKAVSPHGDPIELTAEKAREIASALLQLAAELDALEPN